MPIIVDRIPSDERLGRSADVVVIGAGIIGVCAAYYLAKRGQSVAVVEKGHVAAEQSGRNWGWCRQQTRPRIELPFARESLQLWEEIQRDIGCDLGFRRSGVLSLTNDAKEASDWERWVISARDENIPSSMLTSSQVAARLPGNTRKWLAGIYTESDGRAEPAMAAPAIALSARKHGVAIHQDCAARGLEIAGGAVSAVVTEKGRIRTSAVVLAGGAWSSLFCRRHGIRLPIGLVDATACYTTPVDDFIEGALGTSSYCIRRRLDRGLTLAIRGYGTVDITPQLLRNAPVFWTTFLRRRKGLKIRLGRRFFEEACQSSNWQLDSPSPFESARIQDPTPDLTLVDAALRALADDNPHLKGVKIARVWGGTIDSTPDTLPVISSVQSLPGLYLATGFSGAGFGTGPAAGRLVADIILGDNPIVDPHPYRYQRFVDGSRLHHPPL